MTRRTRAFCLIRISLLQGLTNAANAEGVMKQQFVEAVAGKPHIVPNRRLTPATPPGSLKKIAALLLHREKGRKRRLQGVPPLRPLGREAKRAKRDYRRVSPHGPSAVGRRRRWKIKGGTAAPDRRKSRRALANTPSPADLGKAYSCVRARSGRGREAPLWPEEQKAGRHPAGTGIRFNSVESTPRTARSNRRRGQTPSVGIVSDLAGSLGDADGARKLVGVLRPLSSLLTKRPGPV